MALSTVLISQRAMGNVCLENSGKAVLADQSIDTIVPTAIVPAEPTPAEKKERPPEPKPEPVVIPDPPPQAPRGLIIEFDQGNVELTEKPLGITFADQMPFAVRNVEMGAGGDKAGVKPGWVCKKIAESVVDGCQYSEAMSILKRSIERLPITQNADTPGALMMWFVVSPGYLKRCAVTKKPLGVGFGKDKKVTKVVSGSHGEDIGIKLGWQLSRINDKDVAKLDVNAIAEMIKQG